MLQKLGINTPITKVDLSLLQCSSVSLNELLSMIYVNISEEGLDQLEFSRFPKECELDESLLTKIAYKAKNLKTLNFGSQKLQP